MPRFALSLLIVGAPLAAWAYVARRFVRHNATFYASTNILLAGIGIGIITLCAVVALLAVSGLPAASAWIGGVFGLAAITTIGIRPDRIDWAKKSRQTAIVAAVSYGIIAGGAYLWAAAFAG